MNNSSLNNAAPENPAREVTMIDMGGIHVPDIANMSVRILRSDKITISEAILISCKLHKNKGLLFEVHFDINPNDRNKYSYKFLTIEELKHLNPHLSIDFKAKISGSTDSKNDEESSGIKSLLNGTIQSLAGTFISKRENS